ncbi:MAG TPA: DinB family protein [Longimicrobiaceae bacterium]|nr:DinB family protein [Longimicrobiaceae bacterium]
MSEIERIRDQLRRALEGEAWHGPSLREALAGVGAGIASARPIPGAHTIRELVHHLAAWHGVVRRRLEGEAVHEPEEGDFPDGEDGSEQGWQALLEKLEARNRELLDTVARVDGARLDEPVLEGWSSTYSNLHGTAQHALYHAGQIVLLRKAVAGG